MRDAIYQNLLKNTSHATLIDVEDPDIDQKIQRISECDYIASTSLHGLIVADSFEIPNIWLKSPSIHKGGNFKFYDYFASVGRPDYRQLPIDEDTNLDDLRSNILSTAYFRNILRIQNQLIDSFPAELMGN